MNPLRHHNPGQNELRIHLKISINNELHILEIVIVTISISFEPLWVILDFLRLVLVFFYFPFMFRTRTITIILYVFYVIISLFYYSI